MAPPNTPPCTEPVSIGEGFAYFRWHCLVFPHSECRGWRDPANDCRRWWQGFDR